MHLPIAFQRLTDPGTMEPLIETLYGIGRRRHIIDPRCQQRMQVVAQCPCISHQRSALACMLRRGDALAGVQSTGAQTPFDETFRLTNIVFRLRGVAIVDRVDEIQTQSPAVQADSGDRTDWSMALLGQYAFVSGAKA